MFDRHAFWKDPDNSGAPSEMIPTCRPEFYLDLANITRLVVLTLSRYADKNMSIVELGCGTGRNLVGLRKAGFIKLAGIEISKKAVDLGRLHFPEYRHIHVEVAPIEEAIIDLPPYDVIFTSGVLMHLPPEMEWVIEMMTEKARHLIMVNEGERQASLHAWPHDYQGLIEAGGIWKQVEMETGEKYPPLPATTVKRVFLRADDGD